MPTNISPAASSLATQAAETTIRLDDSDIRAGLALEIEATKAAARLQAIQEAARLHAETLFTKYGVDPEQYILRDWLTGFEQVNGGVTWQLQQSDS